MIKQNLLDENIYKFLAFVRFLVFDDEENLSAFTVVATQRANQLVAGSDFQGYFDPVSNHNESLAWIYIDQFVGMKLQNYQQKKDEYTETMYDTERAKVPLPNQLCVEFIRSERKVLHFLQDMAKKAESVLQMTKKEAHKEINSWPDNEYISDYFKKNVANQLLEDNEKK